MKESNKIIQKLNEDIININNKDDNDLMSEMSNEDLRLKLFKASKDLQSIVPDQNDLSIKFTRKQANIIDNICKSVRALVNEFESTDNHQT